MSGNKLMRIEPFYIGYEVDCLHCEKMYIPANAKYLEELDIPYIFANNYCCRACLDADRDEVNNNV